MSILVNHLHVVQTVNVGKSIIKLFVLVYQHILEVLQVVDLNALSVQNVPLIKLVKTKNALILALIFVVQMLNVGLIIIVLFVHVKMVTLGIHLLDVIQSHVRSRFILFCRNTQKNPFKYSTTSTKRRI